MATYTSSYTGAQIDAGIAQSTVYVHSTALTGTTGTISSAADLIAAMAAKAPITIPFGTAANKVTLYYAYDTGSGTNDSYNYVGTISKDGLTNAVYSMYMTVSGTSVSWTLYKTEIPVPDTADNGNFLKILAGQFALSTGLPFTTTAPSAANTDGIKIVVLSSEPATKYDGYLYLITGA